MKFYHDEDADLSILKDKVIGIIGYGNQGRAQGMNMKDNGLNVMVGSIKDESWDKAKEDGLKVSPIAEVAKASDILIFLIPDEVQSTVYNDQIKKHLKKGKVIVFAHGYNINFGFIQPPPDVDVIMLAPRMIGVGVRKLFEKGSGAPAYIGVHQNASGSAHDIVLALAKAIGATRAGVIETSFSEETEIDHFMEQVVWAAIMRVILLSYDVLVEAGYPPEVAALELYGSREAAEVFEDMASTGIIKQMSFHSRTSQYGTLSRGPRLIPDGIKRVMNNLLKEIQEGIFVREWELEQKLNFPVFNKLKVKALKHQINDAESIIKNNIKISKIMD